jgi:hypothetical protein
VVVASFLARTYGVVGALVKGGEPRRLPLRGAPRGAVGAGLQGEVLVIKVAVVRDLGAHLHARLTRERRKGMEREGMKRRNGERRNGEKERKEKAWREKEWREKE